MGGKTGTTDDNADAWFMGYTPQLLAGSWVGFEYTFMRNTADGNTIARPITEYFFRKVLANKKLGIDRDAKFIKPEEMENEINSADIDSQIWDVDTSPDAQGVDQGIDASDYDEGDDPPDSTVGAESTGYEDNNQKPKPSTPKKDTIKKSEARKDDNGYN
jgi:penicillin-binding protein 1A